MTRGDVVVCLQSTLVAGELVSLVGEFDPQYVKLFDFTRSSLRSPFDGNVVYQFETMECVSSFVSDFLYFYSCIFRDYRVADFNLLHIYNAFKPRLF